jgi:hypothetical protein
VLQRHQDGSKPEPLQQTAEAISCRIFGALKVLRGRVFGAPWGVLVCEGGSVWLGGGGGVWDIAAAAVWQNRRLSPVLLQQTAEAISCKKLAQGAQEPRGGVSQGCCGCGGGSVWLELGW